MSYIIIILLHVYNNFDAVDCGAYAWEFSCRCNTSCFETAESEHVCHARQYARSRNDASHGNETRRNARPTICRLSTTSRSVLFLFFFLLCLLCLLFILFLLFSALSSFFSSSSFFFFFCYFLFSSLSYSSEIVMYWWGFFLDFIYLKFPEPFSALQGERCQGFERHRCFNFWKNKRIDASKKLDCP